MKKILLIVAVVLCVAVAGTAFAATVYYDANPVSGSVTADSSVVLSLDGSSTTEEIALVAGQSSIYKIHCGVTTSATNNANGTLTVTLAASSGMNLAGVTATLYTDSACTEANIVTGKTQTGAGSFSVTGIDATTDYWVKVTFAGAETEEALASIGGSMTVAFVQA